MPWDPSVLRKYSSTSHFRLLNQVRGELKSQPLTRHPDGEINVGLTRRGTTYRLPADVRGGFGSSRSSRPSVSNEKLDSEIPQGDAGSFRDRLRAIDMR
jgi:hypothetical protein